MPTASMLGIAALIVGLHGMGAFQVVDVRLLGTVAELGGGGDRHAAPLLVALDERINDRWGPPPWSAEQWGELATSLAAIGVEQATLVDPAERVVAHDAGAPPVEGAATIRVPTMLFLRDDGSVLPSALQVPVGPLQPWDAHLVLPAHADGVVRDLRALSTGAERYGPSVFCSWAEDCPPEGALALPLRASDLDTLPTISAAALLNGHIRLSGDEEQGREVLIGLTGPAWSRLVPAGPQGTAAPFPVVVGAALSAAAERSPAAVWPWSRLAALLIVLGLAAIVGHRALDTRGRNLYLVLAPLSVLVVGTGAYLLGWVVPPLTAALALVLLPPVGALLRERTRFVSFLGDVRRVLEVEELHHVPRAHPLTTPEALLKKLGALTRTYLRSERCALLLVEGDTVTFGGGFGLEADDLRLPTSLDQAPWPRVIRRPQVGEAVPRLLQDPHSEARVVPLLEGETLLGFWVIPYNDVVGPPVSAAVAELVRWLRPRLQLLAHQARDARWLPDGLDDQLHEAFDLVNASTEERRHQLDVLRYLAWPLLVADVSGEVVETNLALQRLLRDTDLAAVTSVRELLFRVCGEREVGALCARLFTAREQLALPWRDSSGRAFEVRVRSIESTEHELQGFVAMIQEVTAQERVKEVRTRVLSRASSEMTRHLDALVDLGAHLEPAAAALLSERVDGLLRSTDELQSVAGYETELWHPLPSNVAGLLHLALEELEPVRARREVRLEVDAPDRTLPAHVVPTAARTVLEDLLLSAIRSSPRGSCVRVSVHDVEEGTEIEVHWPGAGLDERVLAVVNAGDASQDPHLPPHLAVFARVREVFEHLEVRTDDLGALVTFRAPRTSPRR